MGFGQNLSVKQKLYNCTKINSYIGNVLNWIKRTRLKNAFYTPLIVWSQCINRTGYITERAKVTCVAQVNIQGMIGKCYFNINIFKLLDNYFVGNPHLIAFNQLDD